MKFSRKICSLLYAGVLTAGTGMVWNPVSAAKYHEPEPVEQLSLVEEAFFSKVEDNRVLPMPDGGFLYGECVVVDENDPDIVYGIYNSALDPNAVTVEEAKQIMNGERSYVSVTPRMGTVPTSLKIIYANTEYLSDEFSGAGWRFSNYRFIPEASTGEYLRWCSIGDGGRVGDVVAASNTLDGTVSGMELPVGVYKYFRSDNVQIYYTYNPLQGTRYLVDNPC